ncbi:DUF6660 family protein [Flagellimonas sp.]|uniref:DUF6660 family protein n=1 Tax=Flagellimonas sp. TaxID=2058762 RepID=UPI003BAEF8B9
MKILTVILSCYFLVLNVFPCSDSEPVVNSENTEVHVDFDHGQHHGDCDQCTPFCQCHCCHSHTVDFGVFNFRTLVDFKPKSAFIYCVGLGTNFTLSLLQPPRETV